VSPQRKALAAALATALAIPAEGLRQIAYYDPPGILTVCYGSTTNVVKGKVYGLEECRARLDADMARAVNRVEACAPGLPVPVLAAFADADFNLGGIVACDKTKSTAARMLAAGNLLGACNELLKWDKARMLGVMVALPGLTKRRIADRDLCMQGVTS
jgi:lysozyme